MKGILKRLLTTCKKAAVLYGEAMSMYGEAILVSKGV